MKSEDKRNISNQLNEYDFKKLKIKFLDKDEIKIFSTLCQDGIFSFDEIIYNNKDIEKYILENNPKFVIIYQNIDDNIRKEMYRLLLILYFNDKKLSIGERGIRTLGISE